MRIETGDDVLVMESMVEKEEQHQWIRDIAETAEVVGTYLVKEKRVGTTRRGEAFISLVLADRSGECEAKVWERAEEFSPPLQRR